MNVLVACEYSGIVRDAFLDAGHFAVSVDILPSESSRGLHFQGCIFEYLKLTNIKFDLMIAHPPCTHLAVSGQWCFNKKPSEPGYKPESLREESLDFVRRLMEVDIPMICIENPVSIISGRIRKSDQTINPYQFGHPEQKRTCLWLKNLPKLVETNNVKEEMMKLPKKQRERILWLSGKDRGKERSKFFTGIASAMAEQWGGLELDPRLEE